MGKRAVKPLRFFAVRGAYNPFIVVYMLLRVSTRLVLGRQRRNNIFRILHWESQSEFLDWIHLPEYLAESCMVKDVKLRVKRKYFRHEPEVSSLLTTLHGRVFIDIGANVGYYSFLLHDNFDKIIAVEPHPKNVQLIQKAKEKYRYDKVSILPRAVGNKTGKTKLYLGSHRGGHSLLQSRRFIQKPNLNYITVKAITLDFLLRTYSNVDLVKVDVEGAEWKVLDGAKDVMNKINAWLIELHDLTRKTELENLMKSFDYKVKWVSSKHVYAWR